MMDQIRPQLYAGRNYGIFLNYDLDATSLTANHYKGGPYDYTADSVPKEDEHKHQRECKVEVTVSSFFVQQIRIL